MIRLLLEHGADPDQKLGKSGDTVRELVEINANRFTPAVLELFRITKKHSKNKF